MALVGMNSLVRYRKQELKMSLEVEIISEYTP